MAVFFLKIAPKHDTKNRYPPISTVTAEMGGFSMIGGTMPRMSKKRKLELSFFLNDRGVWPTTTCAGSVSMSANRASGLL